MMSFYDKRYKKITVFLFISVIFLCVSFLLLRSQLKNSVWLKSQVESVLKNKHFSTLKMDNIEVAWSGFAIKVIIHQMEIIDPVVKLPFFKATKAEVDLSILSWVFSKRIVINKVGIEQGALNIAIDGEKNEIEILGLKKEKLPQNINIQEMIGGLLYLNEIELTDMNVIWITPLGNANQIISGKLYWKNKATQSWKYKGKYEFFLEKTGFNIKQNVILEGVSLYQKVKASFFEGKDNAHVTGNFLVSPNGTTQWDINIKHLSVEPVKDILQCVERSAFSKKIPGWLTWLEQSITQGIITHLYWNHSEKPFGEIHFEEATLRYHSEWPPLKGIEGKWLFSNNDWELEATEATIEEVPVNTLSATGKIKNNKIYQVTVNGELTSTLEKGVVFLNKTPLKKIAGEALKENHVKGDMLLNLYLDIPIKIPSDDTKAIEYPLLPIKVQGSMLVNHLSMHHDGSNVQITDGRGKIDFTETGVESTLESSSLLVPKYWPANWPITGPLRFAISWDMDLHKWFFAGRFADAWDAKTTWQDNSILNGVIRLNPGKNQKTHWPEATDETLWIMDNQFEAKLYTKSWKNMLQTDQIQLHFHFLKCPLEILTAESELETLKMPASSVDALPIIFKRPIRLISDSTWLGPYFIGSMHLQGIPEVSSWRLEHFTVERPNFRLKAQGLWSSESNTTTIGGTINSENLGNVLNDWLPGGTNFKEGNAQLSFSLQWPGNPVNFSSKNIFGEVNVNIQNGRLLGVNVGFGRLLGLLSVDNLKRRLQLDFRDVFKKGFVFDNAEAKLQLKGENWGIKWCKVQSPVADLELRGSTNIKTQELSMSIQVTPKSAASGVPVAVAIAGGPALGAGLWAFDKIFMGPQNRKVPSIFYDVTGTWDKPSISKVSSSNKFDQ